MRANFIIVCLLLSNIITYSQTILNGVITDTTGEVLLGATIMLKDKNLGASSNEKGEYSLELPNGKHTIIFSYIGYQNESRSIIANGKPIKLNVKLTQTTEALNEVVIMAKSEEREKREQAMPVAVIDIKDVSGTVNNVNDLLAKTMGMTMRVSGGTGSATRMSVRGLEGNRIGYFIDGIPMNNNSDYVDLNDIPVDMIKRIEIYKGIVPAKFGGNTMGGAVNIVIKEYPPTHIDLSYSLASYNTHRASAILKKNNKEKGYEYGIGGIYTYADNDYRMELPLQNGRYVTRDHDAFEKVTVAGSFTAKKWWFDEVAFESVVIFSKKEIQGIEFNIQEAQQDFQGYVFINNLNKEDFIINGLDIEMSNNYAFSIIRFMDKAMNRFDWDGSPIPSIDILGGEIRPSPNDARNLRHTFLQRANLNYGVNEQHSVNFNSLYNYVNGQPSDPLMEEALGRELNFNSSTKSWIGGLSYEFYTLNKKFTNMFSGKYYHYVTNTIYADIFNVNDNEIID